MSLIRSFPLLGFLLILGVFVGMTAVAVFVALRTRTRAKLMAATPTSNIGFATDGYTELEGVAQPVNGLTLTAPLTGTACLWYHARLERWRRASGSKKHSWSTVWDATSAEPFLMRDSTGACIVFPYGAEVTFTDHSVWFGTTKMPAEKNPVRKGPGESGEGTLKVYGITGNEYRYTEQRIYPGDPLYALGEFSTATWVADEDSEADEDDELGEDDTDDADDVQDADDSVGDEVDASDPEVIDRYDEITEQATALTSRRLQRLGTRPYLLSTTPQAKLQQVHDTGWKGALFVGIVPAAISVLLIWLRFGS